MNRMKERELIAKYPKIFRQRDLQPSETAMCWGLECSEFWFPIIDRLCAKIQAYVDDKYSKLLHDAVQIEATQVKEKFGSLRFYYEPYDQQVEEFILEAEIETEKTCCRCGTMENVKMTKSGWVQPLCPKCTKEYYEN